MAEKKYYWLKLKENYFQNPKIKKLRKIAGGDTFTVIYLKMQLLSIKNKGTLKFEKIDNSFADEIALKIDEDVDNVTIVLNYLKNQCLIEYSNDMERILFIEANNNMGSECDSAERVRAFRESKKALQCNGDVTNALMSNVLISNISNISNIYNNSNNKDNKENKEINKEKKERKENGAYSLQKNLGIPLVDQMATQNREEEKRIDNNSNLSQDIFDFWNAQNIVVHQSLTHEIELAVLKAKKMYSVQQIKLAIEHYNQVYHDETYFFKYKWSLKDFLTRKNGIPDFLEDGTKWVNYCADKKQSTPNTANVPKCTAHEVNGVWKF